MEEALVAKRFVVVAEVKTERRAVKVFPTFRLVVVAAEPVAEVKLRVVMFPRVLKRSVEVPAVVVERVMSAPAELSAVMFARVLKRSVLVAAVVVEFPIERNWYVEDALTIVLVAESEPTFWSAKELAKMLEVHGVWLPALSVPQMRTPAALVSIESQPMSEAIARLVVVALVPVAEVKVSVEKFALVLKRSVEEAAVVSAFVPVNVVAKRFVDEEFVIMAFSPVSVPGTWSAVVVAPVNTPLVP